MLFNKANMIKKIFRVIVNSINYCHNINISHCDIKFDNILVNKSHEIKIIDFGFAVKRQKSDDLVSHFCGTPAFMCPEIVKRKPYDPNKADVWALGVLLYKLITGCYPFKADNDQELYSLILTGNINYHEFVDEEAQEILNGMLDKDEKTRFDLDKVLNTNWLR